MPFQCLLKGVCLKTHQQVQVLQTFLPFLIKIQLNKTVQVKIQVKVHANSKKVHQKENHQRGRELKVRLATSPSQT